MRTMFPVLLIVVGLLLPRMQTSFAAQEEKPAYTPTKNYVVEQLRGWTIRVNPAVAAADKELYKATLELLDHQLYQIGRVIPEPALTKLREVEIWVEIEMTQTACMCYHPSKGWLIPNGYNPDKEGTVEVGNAAAFLQWTKGQPWMVLHELAHAFHHQVYGFDYQPIIDAYQRMVESGKYDSVQHISGKPRRHYALTDPMEYFAETTEALFGTNDFYPYLKSELAEVDPEGRELVRKLWFTMPSK